MDCNTPGFPVLHHLLEFTQTHVHWVGDAIQPSHSLSSPSPPAFNRSQHQGLFKWATSSHQVAKVLELQLQHESFQDWFPLGLIDLTSLQSKGLSRIFSNTTVQSISSSALSFLYGLTLTSIHNYWKKHSFDIHAFVSKVMSLLFNMLSRLVITFLPRSKCSLGSLSAIISRSIHVAADGIMYLSFMAE